MKYVNRVQRPDGTVQLYLRKRGLPSVRLPDGLGEAALARHVAALVADLAPDAAAPPSTFSGALRAYELTSPDFRILAASTKYEYRLILKEFEDDLGRLAVSAFTPAFVDRLKGAWARRGHRAANIRLQVLKNVLKPQLVAGRLAKDPFPLVGQVRRPRELKEPHLIWSDAVFAKVMEAALAAEKFGLARALAVGRYVGARRGDLVAIPRTAREAGRVRFMSGKRRIRVDVPEDPRLTAWLGRTPESPPDRPRRGRKARPGEPRLATTTLVYNVAGRPYTEDGLALELRKLVARLHQNGAIDSGDYDLHGLRHTRGVELALAGCSDAEGAAMMGHGSASSFAQYRRQADRIRLADAAEARLAARRGAAPEQAANEKCNEACNQSATEPLETKKDRGNSSVL
ncbi:tyrosine-type recombinase/integrase [Phenylobacterium deserti]|uniref:Tyr recombinase domain-containing protein n=1 Tax=Phenylobacterium deserti TaxID=1914756 RepID=A0A328ACX7_9CAUL|nr:hypothetical protein [Phenylobacterium deserti]RAK52612.1 hypothetical protein DJ018_10430 [Phenylobacterium deserti]